MKHRLRILVVTGMFATSCRPDLRVATVSTGWDAQNKQVAAEVYNDGVSASPPATVRFTAMPSPSTPGVPEVVLEEELKPVQPGGGLESAMADFYPLATAANNCLAGLTTVKVVVDPRNAIKELNKNNNSMTVSILPPVRRLPPEGPPGSLAVKIDTPPDSQIAGRPISLRFTIDQPDLPHAVQSYPLRDLKYALYHGAEDTPFFADVIVLFGENSPITVEATPGVRYPYPSDGLPIRVEAELSYAHEGGGPAYGQCGPLYGKCALSVFRIQATAAGRYEQYRDGFLRRHLADSGREFGPVWLKEYEPEKDRPELLWHSRTSTIGGRTRVFVPWTHTCPPSGCGVSVEGGAVVLYGGDENPLLKNGLAMSVFSLEYLATGNANSLRHAVNVFEYVERSEWKDPTDSYALTGFFVRSDWPGHKDRDTNRESIFASVDELAGMSLGLLRLNAALSCCRAVIQQRQIPTGQSCRSSG